VTKYNSLTSKVPEKLALKNARREEEQLDLLTKNLQKRAEMVKREKRLAETRKYVNEDKKAKTEEKSEKKAVVLASI